uniref:Uncharacterized protein n=1 Tax=Noctiluca scintillans TaxID=2966 RepID=A0A7S1ALL2_NOCSC|mmetsp:Transcript_49791/g.132054  ORF Transcript_49791/g.132054 Transcript_49791/m.132054 type:complete len:201 (+) Transcript_49791:41-643(+)
MCGLVDLMWAWSSCCESCTSRRKHLQFAHVVPGADGQSLFLGTVPSAYVMTELESIAATTATSVERDDPSNGAHPLFSTGATRGTPSSEKMLADSLTDWWNDDSTVTPTSASPTWFDRRVACEAEVFERLSPRPSDLRSVDSEDLLDIPSETDMLDTMCRVLATQSPSQQWWYEGLEVLATQTSAEVVPLTHTSQYSISE